MYPAGFMAYGGYYQHFVANWPPYRVRRSSYSGMSQLAPIIELYNLVPVTGRYGPGDAVASLSVKVYRLLSWLLRQRSDTNSNYYYEFY